MEKNGNKTTTSDSTGVCEKIFRAITVSPSFRTIRRITHFPQLVSPARPDSISPISAGKIIDIQSKPPQPKFLEATKVIRIPITSKKRAATSNVQAQKITKVTKTEMLAQPQKASYTKVEEKQNPKSPVVQEAKSEGKKADINDTFSAYINRAKMKIRTMSSNKIGESDDGNHDAEKREGCTRDHFSDYIHGAKNKFKSTPSSIIGNGKIASFKRE